MMADVPVGAFRQAVWIDSDCGNDAGVYIS